MINKKKLALSISFLIVVSVFYFINIPVNTEAAWKAYDTTGEEDKIDRLISSELVDTPWSDNGDGTCESNLGSGEIMGLYCFGGS
jgi:hypothetical protein